MKYLNVFLLAIFSWTIISGQTSQNKTVVYDDIDRFWKAYDMILETADTSLHKEILETEFINQGTPGLFAIIEKKGYTVQEYVDAIREYPSFWNSIRGNTLRTSDFAEQIDIEIGKFRKWYPDAKPAHIYFTIGVLRTGGTAHEGHVLIGSELALADSTAVTQDIQPDWLRQNHEVYLQSNPIDDVILLNVHEYVHTQQSDYGYDLLSQCIYEGVAEFVSVLSYGGTSASPAVKYAVDNKDQVRRRFESEMFSPHWNNWLYNSSNNEFQLRDMGYGVGYSICQAYFDNAPDKSYAIKTMIELDYKDTTSIESFAAASGYFSSPMSELKNVYESNSPQVLGIAEFKNGSTTVEPSITNITLRFSRPMSDQFMNHKLGPLGREYLLPIKGATWSEDKRSLTYSVLLEPNKRYQIVVDNEFRALDGPVIDRYLIDFTTANH